MKQKAYCRNCNKFVVPTEGINWIFFILFTIFLIVPGLIYFFLKVGKGGKCPICGGKNWGNSE
ncbi:MAG: hypothetical protein ACNYWM_11655 [Methanosarcinales archaeon]